MKKLLLALAILIPACGIVQNITTPFEQSNGKQSPTYPQIIDWWKKMDKRSEYVKMLTMGMTDAGYPLHLVIVSADKDFNFESIRKKNKRIILINNGIHPGEPDGIDASMLLVRDINAYYEQEKGTKNAAGRIPVNSKLRPLPENVVLAIIPVYNIGGCLNRSPNYRIDQNGPEEKGFRGNSQNLDLNRDFIKCDSKEARSFTELFHMIDPDVLVDNHVSDGADYQHVMTLICSQHDRLGGDMGAFMHEKFEPGLYSLMKQRGYDLVPYVNEFGDSPETGWPAFMDSPRYSSGYATLWQCFGFIPETHMLKPYDQRVKATYALMQSFIDFTSANSAIIKLLRLQARESVKKQEKFPISWTLDKSQSDPIQFKGYQAGHKPSEISGQPRLYYDRDKPFEKQVPFFNHYIDGTVIEKAKAYIIPQGWWRAIDLLKLNKVQMSQLKNDSLIEVSVYHIEDFKSSSRPYEQHHMNGSVRMNTQLQKIQFRKGDYLIPLDQAANRFIVETLEPQGEDSYFAWNFFDAILGAKEGFSDYSFEDIAANYLKNNPAIQSKLDQRKSTDTAFVKNGGAQLNFVYMNSPYFEPDYERYPVYRIIQ